MISFRRLVLLTRYQGLFTSLFRGIGGGHGRLETNRTHVSIRRQQYNGIKKKTKYHSPIVGHNAIHLAMRQSCNTLNSDNMHHQTNNLVDASTDEVHNMGDRGAYLR